MVNNPDSFRTFIAIELPADLRARVAQHIASLRRELPDVRASWSREDNLHLTLKFLGNVPVADIPKVSAAVERATKTFPSFQLTFSDCGTFPPHGRPKVLWIGAVSAGRGPQVGSGLGVLDVLPASTTRPRPAPSNLERLFNAIEEELSGAGFARETRPFHPHLTIARLRSAQGGRQVAKLHRSLGFEPVTIDILDLVVFRSELRQEGSKHTALSRYKLLKEPASNNPE